MCSTRSLFILCTEGSQGFSCLFQANGVEYGALKSENEEGTLPTGIRKVIWDNATDFENKFQARWYRANFSYDPITNTATTVVLIIHNASVHTTYPITVLGLNHNGTILCPLRHRVWAQKDNDKWQTVDGGACATQGQQGFVCESNTISKGSRCLS